MSKKFFKELLVGFLCLFSFIKAEGNADALLNVTKNTVQKLVISFRNYECNNCLLKDLAILDQKGQQNVTLSFDTFYSNYFLFLKNKDTQEKYCNELLGDTLEFGEHGVYLFEIKNDQKNVSKVVCELKIIENPENIYTPLYVAVGIIIGITIIYIIAKQLYRNNYHRIFCTYKNKNLVSDDLGAVSDTSNSITSSVNTSTYLIDDVIEPKPKVSKVKSGRMKSVDVFRGLCLCVMIFANYGAGGYSSLDHAPWNGLNLADTVFPCFVFIMGISIPLSLKSISNRSVSREGNQPVNIKSLIYKILKRTVLLFFFGLLTSNSSDKRLSELRIMGVLQRFSISYFVCVCIELIYFKLNNYSFIYLENPFPETNWLNSKKLLVKLKFQELYLYPIQWLIVTVLMTIWLLLTFFFPVNGCKVGYLGPGGLDDEAKHFNCTAGAAGAIDRIILGQSHIYQTPTFKSIYKNTLPHDPEGLLGCLTSCILTYFGVSCGHMIIHYKESRKRIIRFLFYGFFYGLIALILCKFSKNDGWIPINKNLWSLSFILLMASISFITLTLLYLLIDIYDLYSGTPFLYLGRNSITIYICHIIFQNYFPFFKVDDTHSYMLAMDLYGITWWLVIAGLMDYKKVYINL